MGDWPSKAAAESAGGWANEDWGRAGWWDQFPGQPVHPSVSVCLGKWTYLLRRTASDVTGRPYRIPITGARPSLLPQNLSEMRVQSVSDKSLQWKVDSSLGSELKKGFGGDRTKGSWLVPFFICFLLLHVATFTLQKAWSLMYAGQTESSV